MARHILKCLICGKYTMKSDCCEKTVQIKPPKFSPEDPYGDYRREARRPLLEEKGLL